VRQMDAKELISDTNQEEDGTESVYNSSSSSCDEENEDLEVSSVGSQDDEDDINLNDEHGILNDDLGSKWHYLGRNELAMTDKDNQIKSLSETVTGQESSLESVRAEYRLMRMQILQLETARNEFKSQCELKDSALQISQERISSLEEEVVNTHAQCLAFEEDFEAIKESFATQKVATKQEMTNSQDEAKILVDQVRDEFKEKLNRREEELNEVKDDHERIIRDLKTSVEEIEAERDNLKKMLTAKSISPIVTTQTYNYVEEEKKEDDSVAEPPALVSPNAFAETDSEKISNLLAEKAAKQAFKIANLTEENEMKDEQLRSLQEMVEMLLGKRNGEGELQEEGDGKRRAWGKRITNLRANTRQKASDILNRSGHGSQHGTWHGSQHGSQHGTWHGSQHGSHHGMPNQVTN